MGFDGEGETTTETYAEKKSAIDIYGKFGRN